MTVTVTAATGDSGQDGSGSAGSEAPRKLTRYEAMWTDCDPALWEYVVM